MKTIRNQIEKRFWYSDFTNHPDNSANPDTTKKSFWGFHKDFTFKCQKRFPAIVALLTLPILVSFHAFRESPSHTPTKAETPFVVVLGVAQDGGLPQAGCQKACCRDAWNDAKLQRRVSCLAIVDPISSERWMIDATPDFKQQLRALDEIAPVSASPGLAGILLTHGHIGHYSGLMHLGREVLGAREIPVYVMPRMQDFLSRNGPWDQLVRLKNIVLQPMQNDLPFELNQRIRITPLLVPHRDEYTETAGFRIAGPQRSVIFIPDIDKWEKWDRRIEEVIAGVDAAYVDGTFYDDGEIPGRNMAEIPHPFIVETMQRLAQLPAAEKSKVRFIHLNHTNPALRPESEAARAISKAGFRVAMERERLEL